jgi:positive regulator of sigma E activity
MNVHRANKDLFTHSGYISKIKANSVVVALEPNLECDACHAKGVCGATGAVTKKIEVYHSEETFDLNDHVKVYLKKTTGLKAVFWAYIFPFFLMFLSLLISSNFLEEWLAGLVSLFILVPYYVTLHVLKNKLKASFRVSVLKS